jgi:hypothetical protein
MLPQDDSFTPLKLRDYLLLYLNPLVGQVTYPGGATDVAITVGNSVTDDVSIQGIEINIPLFPDCQELSLVDVDTASYLNLWELHIFQWDDSDQGRVDLYNMLGIMVRMLSNVRITCCPAGISNNFKYSEHYCVTFRQTCTGDKLRAI